MAPWAYEPKRLEEVNGRLDVYPLGKVLWSMVAGKNGFMREDWNRPENDLGKVFPDNPSMRLINGILERSVVREEKDCIKSAVDLLPLVEDAVAQLRKGAEKPDQGPWPCRVCGKGEYRPVKRLQSNQAIDEANSTTAWIDLRLYVCDQCKHVQIFDRT